MTQIERHTRVFTKLVGLWVREEIFLSPQYDVLDSRKILDLRSNYQFNKPISPLFPLIHMSNTLYL